VLPTAEETRSFLADQSSDKRDRLIESLFRRPEFVDYWTYKWSDLLLVTKRKLKPAAMWAYYDWIRKQVASNTPWDQFARGLLTAQGSTLENGAANYFVMHQDPRECAETTSLTFLGFSMNCAKCHNHPMEKWTNNDYYGFANLFSRVRFKAGAQEGDNIVFRGGGRRTRATSHGQATIASPPGRQATRARIFGRSTHGSCRLANVTRQRPLLEDHCESRLGKLPRGRPRRERR
jgi:hypothetical protein